MANGMESDYTLPVMNLTLVILIGLAAALGVGVYLFLRSRQPKEEPIHHFPCPHCRQRLGYKARQVGHPGSCPRCGKRLTFPPAAGE